MSAVAHAEYVGEILVRHGVVDAARLIPLLDTVRERGQTLTELMISTNVADATKIAQAFAAEMGMDFVPKIDKDAIPFDIATRLPITYAKQHLILPISEDDTHVYAVCADPLDTTAVDDVRSIFGKPVEVSVAANQQVLDAINRVWEKRDAGQSNLQGDKHDEEDNLVDIIDSDDDAPIIA